MIWKDQSQVIQPGYNWGRVLKNARKSDSIKHNSICRANGDPNYSRAVQFSSSAACKTLLCWLLVNLYRTNFSADASFCTYVSEWVRTNTRTQSSLFYNCYRCHSLNPNMDNSKSYGNHTPISHVLICPLNSKFVYWKNFAWCYLFELSGTYLCYIQDTQMFSVLATLAKVGLDSDEVPRRVCLVSHTHTHTRTWICTAPAKRQKALSSKTKKTWTKTHFMAFCFWVFCYKIATKICTK